MNPSIGASVTILSASTQTLFEAATSTTLAFLLSSLWNVYYQFMFPFLSESTL
jgi:hypothetical protein